jgi:hypothetical protein
MSHYAAQDHDLQPVATADWAAMIRTRLQRRRPPPLPQGDRAIALLAGVIVALGLAATGLALWMTRPLQDVPVDLVPTRVGEITLAIPENLAGADTAEGRLVGMARLRLDWPSLGPVSPESRHRLLVTLSPPDKVNEPAMQLSVYARFLTSTVWSNPGGLVVRGFRKGSPYENDELYVSVPDGRGFAARCPLPAPQLGFDELCRATIRHRGLDVNIRFPRAIVADWQRMLAGVRRTVDAFVR